MTTIFSLDAPDPEPAAKKRQIAFVLPFALPSLNVRQRTHWAELHRQQQKLSQEVMVAIGGPRHFPRPPFEGAHVHVVRCSPGELDPDNLHASVKALLDCLKLRAPANPIGLSIMVDDAPGRCELIVTQQRAAEASTAVRVEEVAYVAPARRVPVRRSGKAATRGLAASHRANARMTVTR